METVFVMIYGIGVLLICFIASALAALNEKFSFDDNAVPFFLVACVWPLLLFAGALFVVLTFPYWIIKAIKKHTKWI